jgi:hypothetical protein
MLDTIEDSFRILQAYLPLYLNYYPKKLNLSGMMNVKHLLKF